MIAEILLKHFHRIADAPDALPRLRRFIVDLAVRGKLVEQDPEDEPATELLNRIKVEKAKNSKGGKLRKAGPHSNVEERNEPFTLPSLWAWCHLGDIIHLVSGQHLKPEQYSTNEKSGLPYITGPADFSKDGLVITRYALVRKAVAREGQILLTVKGAGVGKTTTCNLPEVAISRQLMAMTPIQWSHRFLLLSSHRLARSLQENMRSLIPGISRDDVEYFVVGIPPLAEQHRIVAKVDELMTLCDRLEAQITNSQSLGRRLLESTLHAALTKER